MRVWKKASISGLTKKELLQLQRERDKLELSWAVSAKWATCRISSSCIDTNKESDRCSRKPTIWAFRSWR